MMGISNNIFRANEKIGNGQSRSSVGYLPAGRQGAQRSTGNQPKLKE